MTGTILVPVDGSLLAERAVGVGARLARQLGMRLFLLRVAPIPEAVIRVSSTLVIPIDEQAEALRHEAEDYLRLLATQWEATPLPVVQAGEREEISGTIARVASEENAAYLVMSTHGRTGIARWALGSVTDRVLRLSTCPVLVCPVPANDFSAPPASPVFGRIVVPLDGSARAEAVLIRVREIAHACGSQVSLLRVVMPLVMEGGGLAVPLRETEWWTRLLSEARAYLQGVQEQLQAEGLEVSVEVMSDAPPAEAILDFAETTDAALIAMTTHARSLLARAILGSVADRVVRASQVPVLLVPPERKEP